MDIYNESRKLAALLIARNAHSASQEILDAINYSSTGTEALMRLRSSLKALIANKSYNDLKIAELTQKILSEIDMLIGNG